MAIRPPITIDKKSQAENFISDERNPAETPVGRLVSSFDREDGSQIPNMTKAFIKENEYDIDFPTNQEGNPLIFIIDFVKTFNSDRVEDLKGKIENILDSTISNFLGSDYTRLLLSQIWDRYYAFYILGRTEPQNLENLTQCLRVFHLLSLLSTDREHVDIQRILTAKPLIPKLFTDLPKPKIKAESPEEIKPKEEQIKAYKQLWTDLINTHRAIEEVKNLKYENKFTTETKNISISNKETGREDKAKISLSKSTLFVKKSSFESLHASTKAILEKNNITDATIQLNGAISTLQSRMEQISSHVALIDDPHFINYMPAEAKSIQGIASISGRFNKDLLNTRVPYTPPTNIRSSIKPLGIGDLKVVKQKLKKYAAGEVAHIENVLRGEFKERKHRVLDRTEDILAITNENSEETIKDTQTTERFELKKESEKSIQEQMSVQAGVTVSGSYGMVTFGAHGDFAYSNATQESHKNASNFAREVIDRAVSKIQKKSQEERISKKLHEVEEINIHGIDNKGQPDHVSGIYRWVDKYYEAQIYNYGKRMMFEFIIPEPAAFFEYAQNNKPKKVINPPAVPYRWVQDSKGKWVTDGLITHKDISEWNYQNYIRDYNVQGVTVPPPFMRIASLAIDQGGIDNARTSTKSSKELVVPEGYDGVYLGLNMTAIWENFPQFKIGIGETIIDWLQTSNARRAAVWGDPKKGFPGYHDAGAVPVTLNTYDVNSYTANIILICHRKESKYEQWQIHTYEKIMAAYKAMQAEYEQKIAAEETRQGIVIQGQNPRINREIEKTELKKQCIKMLMDNYLFGSFKAMKDDGFNPPDIDIFEAFSEGKTIQFFEQAFEWENLTYLFYPYFWARKSEWIHKSSIYDNDPLFTKFLQAGSSRVVIPVHPAYNDAVMYFMENNGAIWSGGDTPRLKDLMFLSIADELRSQTDDLAGAVAEGEPWEVILPTTLVYLQQDSDLPTF
jgi:hypothetical protein